MLSIGVPFSATAATEPAASPLTNSGPARAQTAIAEPLGRDAKGHVAVALAETLSTWPLRNIGPFRQGSWITAIAVPEVDPIGPHRAHRHTAYVAARNGGVWKTTNAGTTFTNITDDIGLSAVGSLAVSHSHPEVVWIGTGDAENARSSTSGNGVWRSLDGGASWQHRGLEESHHIARILIHPTDPERVWVASMGHLFSSSAQRGVFRTSDGGTTWHHVLDLGPEVGVIDLVLDRENPSRLWAASYDKVRLPWHFEAGGDRSRIYRSDDGGDHWTQLSGSLPEGRLGRIGLDRFRNSSPHSPASKATADGSPTRRSDTLYAVIENLNPAPSSYSPAGAGDASPAGAEPAVVGNEVYRSDDGGDHWRRVSPAGQAIGSKSAYAFNEIRVDPWNPERVYVLSETLITSVDGGATYRDLHWPADTLFTQVFGDFRALWIDSADPDHLWAGSDGGVYISHDGGVTSQHLLNLPLAEVYGVAVDDAEPFNVYAGLQDHEAWRAPVNSWSGAVTLEDWVMVGRWDGMISVISPDGRDYYATTQFGGHLRADLATGRRVDIEPKAPEGAPEYRFTWTPPIQLSPHDPKVLWAGAQKVLRSPDRGATWEERSPDLTRDDPVKIAGLGHIHYCTITTLAESALEIGLLWVGTDDGRVWLTRDAGSSWTERTNSLVAQGVPEERWTSRVLPSRHAAGRAFIAKSGYRNDDFTPYLLRTDDYGESWRRLGVGLPEAPISAIAEDAINPDLLFVGNDRGVWVTLDGGSSWQPFAQLPTVPVRDIVLQQRTGRIVVGTYGRGVWVGDVSPLREIVTAISQPAHLFPVAQAPWDFTERDDWGAHELSGDSVLAIPNEPDGLSITYWLTKPAGSVGLHVVQQQDGTVLQALELTDAYTDAGFHRLQFPFSPEGGGPPDDGDGSRDVSESAEDADAASAELAASKGDVADPDGPLETPPGSTEDTKSSHPLSLLDQLRGTRLDVEIILEVDGESWRRSSTLLETQPHPLPGLLAPE